MLRNGQGPRGRDEAPVARGAGQSLFLLVQSEAGTDVVQKNDASPLMFSRRGVPTARRFLSLGTNFGLPLYVTAVDCTSAPWDFLFILQFQDVVAWSRLHISCLVLPNRTRLGS